VTFSALPSINLNNETDRMIIRRNASLTLQCPASGYPIPITRWLGILIKTSDKYLFEFFV
jgi:hypothetical protein